MTKNKLLNIAIVICKAVKIAYILTFIATTYLFINVQTNDYKEVFLNFNSITDKSNSVLPFHYTFVDKWKEDTSLKDEEIYTTDKATTFSLYIIYLKYILILLLTYLCINEFQKIIQTTKKYNPFLKNNIKSFRSIGKYLIVYFITTSVSITYYQDGGFSKISLSIGSITLIIVSFILAEIFKEGNKLQQENELTI